jgi:hypothetical protein
MHPRLIALLSVMTTALASVAVFAQTSYPMVMFAYPSAVERGKTTEVTVNSRFTMYGAYKVLIEGAGVSAEIVDPGAKMDPSKPGTKPAVENLNLRITVAPDAALGDREFRIATPQGVSSVGIISITDTPCALETEPNNAPDKPQKIELPVVVNGKVQANEDVDYFQFSAKAGDELTFVVESARTQDKIHDLQSHIDPILVVSDSAGRELVTSDDYFRADPLLHFRVEKDGDYLLQMRDVRYMGDARWTYSLTATRRPFVKAVFPLAVKRGRTTQLETVGFGMGDMTSTPLDVPMDWSCGPREVQLATPGGSTNPVPIIVSDLDESIESEANNDFEHATPIAIPSGISGRIESDGDVDCFKFTAKKGQPYRFEIKARRFDSMLDSYLSMLDSTGREIANNDDLTNSVLTSKDSRLDWTAPADGEFAVAVRDLASRGGPEFVYHLVAQPAEPDFVLECDSDKALIGPGSSTTWFVKVTRQNGFTGDVQLDVVGLPAGVSATCARIPANMTQGCAIVTADWDAPMDCTNVRVIGRATVGVPAAAGSDPSKDGTPTRTAGGERQLVRLATPLQEIYSPGGGRARFPVNMHTVSVMDQSDLIRVEVSRREISLAPGESIQIDVNIKRRSDYLKPINLDVRLRHLGGVFGDPLPPGVTMDDSKSKTLLGENATQGSIVLRAAPNAQPVENLPIAVLGHVSINFVVKTTYSSLPISLSIAPKQTAQTR